MARSRLAAGVDQAIHEVSFGEALRPALGIGFGSDGSEVGPLVISAGDDILSGQAVGDGVLGDGGLSSIGARTGTVLRILNMALRFSSELIQNSS